MKTVLIVFPGTNREPDLQAALRGPGHEAPRLVWHKDTELGRPDLIVLPGGFSYGDYLRCGAMAAHSPAMREVIKLAGRGTPVLGICNGFQILVESGLLPGALLRNASLKFICKNVTLRCCTGNSAFTRKLGDGALMRVPIAHGEGNYFCDDAALKTLEDGDRIAFRYCNDNGDVTAESNPNGSLGNIAGILNEERNVLGLMPHPEDCTAPWQANLSGRALFESLAEAMTS